jgi:hypothetical protein
MEPAWQTRRTFLLKDSALTRICSRIHIKSIFGQNIEDKVEEVASSGDPVASAKGRVLPRRSKRLAVTETG